MFKGQSAGGKVSEDGGGWSLNQTEALFAEQDLTLLNQSLITCTSCHGAWLTPRPPTPVLSMGPSVGLIGVQSLRRPINVKNMLALAQQSTEPLSAF